MIQKLNDNFVNVATDINRAQHQRDAEGEFFRKIAEQGHYAGRTKPTNTRQGLYVATADGELLASVNTTSARRALNMIDSAIAKWNQSTQRSRQPFATRNEPDRYFNKPFPEGGLILRETLRDLPRANDPDYQTWRHNFDHVWLTQEEAAWFIPNDQAVGHSYTIAPAVVQRLARFHFVDQVKGEADAYCRTCVSNAELTGKIIENENDQLTILVEGNAKCVQPPSNQVNPYSGSRVEQERGVDVMIRGWIKYNLKSKSFVKFDLLAAGDRWGAATYNFRHRDLGPAPIGFAFELIPTEAENKTQPKFLLWDYFQ